MIISINTTELIEILDKHFERTDNQYNIHYYEPELIWRKRNDIRDIGDYKDLMTLEQKYPRINHLLIL